MAWFLTFHEGRRGHPFSSLDNSCFLSGFLSGRILTTAIIGCYSYPILDVTVCLASR